MNIQSIKRPSNAGRYKHIPTTRIIELFNQGLSHRKIGKLLGMGPCSVRARLRREGKVRTRPGLIGEELEEARLDPAWEARHGIANRVVCRVCGKLMASINANGEHSHLRTHRMTAKEYVSKYPGMRLFSFATAAAQSLRQGRNGDVRRLMEAFAQRYVKAKDLIECRKDHEWEERHDFDFVVCRKCGHMSKTDLHAHAKRHGYDGAGPYRAEYPKAGWVPMGLKRGYRKKYARGRYLRKKAELTELEARASKYPPDWDNKPFEWRIIADLLLSSDNISNEELGARLDTSRIIICPRNYGARWKAALASDKETKSRAATDWLTGIRKWIGRPGKRGKSRRSNAVSPLARSKQYY